MTDYVGLALGVLYILLGVWVIYNAAIKPSLSLLEPPEGYKLIYVAGDSEVFNENGFLRIRKKMLFTIATEENSPSNYEISRKKADK